MLKHSSIPASLCPCSALVLSHPHTHSFCFVSWSRWRDKSTHNVRNHRPNHQCRKPKQIYPLFPANNIRQPGGYDPIPVYEWGLKRCLGVLWFPLEVQLYWVCFGTRPSSTITYPLTSLSCPFEVGAQCWATRAEYTDFRSHDYLHWSDILLQCNQCAKKKLITLITLIMNKLIRI